MPRSDFPTYCATRAFLHSWLVSLRHQLRDSDIEVLELIPPYVATTLVSPEQAHDPRAMPVAEYLAEVMDLLEGDDLPRGEIVVERSLARRNAERDGKFTALFAAQNPA